MAHKNKEAFVKKMALSRRHFLGTAGTIVTLPYLESLLPKHLWSSKASAAATTAKRFIFYFHNAGVCMPRWVPNVSANDAALPAGISPILSPLDPYRSRTLVLQGLSNVSSGTHEIMTAGILTQYQNGNQLKKAGEEAPANLQSLDQLIAGEFAPYTRVKSLELAPGKTTDNAIWKSTISYASRDQRLAPNFDEGAIFKVLFDGFDPSQSDAERTARAAQEKSVLDFVIKDAQSLETRLALEDKKKLNEYLDGVRDIEKRVAGAAGASCQGAAVPPSGQSDLAKIKNILDLAILAVRCDVTRVITLFMSDEVFGYNWLSYTGDRHETGHSSDSEWKSNTDLSSLPRPGPLFYAGPTQGPNQVDYEKFGKWHMEQIAYLAAGLDGIKEEGGRSALDNSVIHSCSEISFDHKGMDLPAVVVGTAGGALRSGRFYRAVLPESRYGEVLAAGYNYDNSMGLWGRPLADLYLTLLKALGIDRTSFGLNGRELLNDLLA